MSLRDIGVEIGVEVENDPLVELDKKINGIIGLFEKIDPKGFEQIGVEAIETTKQMGQLEDSIDDISGTLKSLDYGGLNRIGSVMDDIENVTKDAADEFKGLERAVDHTGDELKDLDYKYIKDIEKSANDSESAMNGLKSAVVGVGTAIVTAIAVDKIVEFGTGAVEAAAGAQALNSQFEQVFGDLQDETIETINVMAIEFNMLPSRLKAPMAQMTSMFKGLGIETKESMELAERAVTLVADAAAFYDMRFEDANSSLNSFIKGNYEGGESIGLFANETQMAAFAVSEGLIKASKEWAGLDEATKQATRLDYAENMQELAEVTGQASREGEGYENVMGNLNQAWQDFLAIAGAPILEHVIDVLGWLTETLVDIDPGPFMEFISDAFESLLQFVDYIVQVKDALIEFGKSSGTFEFVANAIELLSEYIDILVNQYLVPLMPVAEEIVTSVMTFIGGVIEGTTNVFMGLWSIIEGLFNNVFVPLFPVMQEIITVAFQFINPILELAGSLFDAVASVIRFLVEEVVVPLFPLVTATIETAWNIISPILSALADAFNVIVDSVDWALEKITSFFNYMSNMDAGKLLGSIAGGAGDLLGAALGFDTGLGRVPYDNMPAYLHKDEAVLQAENADVLRDAGILKGDGRHPEIDLTAANQQVSDRDIRIEGPKDYRNEKIASANNQISVHAPVNIYVQGGNTNEETGQSVRDVVEEFFADLTAVMPQVREG